jgi:hypothetical protein
LGNFFQEGLTWPQNDQEWDYFSQFLENMISSQSQSRSCDQETKKWLREAGFFKDIDQTEKKLGQILTRDQVMSALIRSPPTNKSLAKKIESQIFEYEL